MQSQQTTLKASLEPYLIILCAHGSAKIDGTRAVPPLHARAGSVG